jgi:hypothetical protein
LKPNEFWARSCFFFFLVVVYSPVVVVFVVVVVGFRTLGCGVVLECTGKKLYIYCMYGCVGMAFSVAAKCLVWEWDFLWGVVHGEEEVLF